MTIPLENCVVTEELEESTIDAEDAEGFSELESGTVVVRGVVVLADVGGRSALAVEIEARAEFDVTALLRGRLLC